MTYDPFAGPLGVSPDELGQDLILLAVTLLLAPLAGYLLAYLIPLPEADDR